MPNLTFKKGIHPNDQKIYTRDKAIVTIEPKTNMEMIFAMQQHIGAPCNPIVEISQKVFVGEIIATSDAFVSSPIISSVSGIVKEFRDTVTPNGIRCKSIVIENDGEYLTNLPELNRNPKDLSKEEILKIIKDNGIVGLGGAGFPTHIKLNPPKDKKIDYFILNAAECEPYLTTDYRIMLEDGKSLVEGIKIILQLFPGAKAIIGIETNKMEAIENMEQLTKDIPEIEVARLTPKYPQGSEKQLIDACIKREVPSGGLPSDVGVIVDNVDTVRAIYRAVCLGKTLISRIITVSGGAAKSPGNYLVRIGMKYKDFLDEIGGFSEEPFKIISGGPMMGVAMYDLESPVIKTSSAILCFTEKEGKLPTERNCIRCARCVDHCPIGLMPLILNQNVLDSDKELFQKNNGLDCIECGSCSYVCPSKRHLAQSIRAARREIMSSKKK